MPDGIKRILVAEDEKSMSSALEAKLKISGFDVRVANNGKEALELLSSEKFDLVLLDLIMPYVDGFQVLAELKKNNFATPIIVASNLGQKEDVERAKALGAIDYFIKSDTSISDIIIKVTKALNK